MEPEGLPEPVRVLEPWPDEGVPDPLSDAVDEAHDGPDDVLPDPGADCLDRVKDEILDADQEEDD